LVSTNGVRNLASDRVGRVGSDYQKTIKTRKLEMMSKTKASHAGGRYYVEIIWTLENLSTEPLKRTVLNFCFNVNNGGGGWANREFLPKSGLNRTEDGEYWHSRVARKGAYVHSGGSWRNEPGATRDASILVVANEAKDRYAFQMWDHPVEGGGINNANACMHLQPVLCESLGVGEKAVIRSRMGISPEGLAQVWHLYKSLTEISKQATAEDDAQQGAPADADKPRR
jgi:hypothetical protein